MALPLLGQPQSTGIGPAVEFEFTALTDLSGEAKRVVFGDWTRARLVRSLHELNGSFELEYDDRTRAKALGTSSDDSFALMHLDVLQPVSVLFDGELVMRGFVEELEWQVEAGQLTARLHGFDATGDLLECTANPEGPAEFHGLTVLQIVERLVKPFGLTVRAEVDVGAPVADYAIDVGESVFSAIDKCTKLRALLVTSDGTGGLVLTRAGRTRAPAPLSSATSTRVEYRLSSREWYSDYWVVGQARTHHGERGRAPIDATGAAPTAGRGAEGDDTAEQAQGARPASRPHRTVTADQGAKLLGVGHAVDKLVTRYRPRVWVARTGAGGAPHQVLAEWRKRIARGHAERIVFTVPDVRAGADARLWRPNEVVAVEFLGNPPVDELVEGVTFAIDERGSRTELQVVAIGAYDLEPLPDEHRRGRNGGRAARGASVNRLPRG